MAPTNLGNHRPRPAYRQYDFSIILMSQNWVSRQTNPINTIILIDKPLLSQLSLQLIKVTFYIYPIYIYPGKLSSKSFYFHQIKWRKHTQKYRPQDIKPLNSC